MMLFETILLEVDQRGIASITLNRPEKHHALNETMMRELVAACDAIEMDQSIRAAVLKADGKSFCAGGDLGWMRQQAGLDREGKIRGARVLADMLRRLDELTKPLIIRVQGNAAGGGIGLMAIGDIVIVSEVASFALTEVKLGLIPATIGPYVLRRIGEGHARRLILNASRFSARDALHYGLASRVVRPEDLDEAVEQEIRQLLDCAPGAVSDAKRFIRALARGETADPIAYSMEALADRWASDEARDRILRFLGA